MSGTLTIDGPHGCFGANSEVSVRIDCTAGGKTVKIGLLPDDGFEGETSWSKTFPVATTPGGLVISGDATHIAGDNLSCDYDGAIVTGTPIVGTGCCSNPDDEGSGDDEYMPFFVPPDEGGLGINNLIAELGI